MTEYTNPKGEFVGRSIGNTYYTERKPQHFMGMYQGFGISKDIIEKLANEGVDNVYITYLGTNGTKKFTTPLLNYINSKKTYTDKTMGVEDLQLFVSKKDMVEII